METKMLFWQLLKTDLSIYKTKFLDRIIDLSIWTSATIIVNGYILQAFGLSSNFGIFQTAGMFCSVFSFEIHSNIFEMVSDLDGNKYISYLLTLPGSNLTIISEKVAFYAITGLISTILIFPLMKILMFHKFNLMTINYPHLIVAMLLTSLFFGWFTIWVVQRNKTVSQIRSTAIRILFPLWFFGCYLFSLKVVYYKVSRVLALLCLISPYTFATEAFRSSILGPEEYIPFWVSICALTFLTVAAGFFGYRGLKKRLDFV